MNANTLHVQLTGFGRTTANLESITNAADAAVWRSAAEELRERTYGDVRVRVEWATLPAEDESVQFDVHVESDDDDAASYAALFFHDAFLMMNVAVPGSFGGVLTILGGGEAEIPLSARMFEYAWATASRNGSPSIEVLPLREAVAWYDALDLDAQQPATEGAAKALFLLLHLARQNEDEAMSVIRLAQALEALALPVPPQLAALRDGPVMHPLAEDDEVSLAFVDAADLAASQVVSKLQGLVARRPPDI